MTEGAAPLRTDAPLVVLAAGRATRYGGVKPLAPVGPHGEAVIDVLAGDALAVGFSSIVLVVGPETGPAIRYHVERTWPREVDVRFGLQEAARGTVEAVLVGLGCVQPGSPVAVANADDLPGRGGLALLADHLAGGDPRHALVAYRLSASLVGAGPVTRGVCEVGPDGLLLGIDERRRVTPGADGRIVADDGREPAELDPGAPVSMNLWGFRPEIAGLLEKAAAEPTSEAEILLPEVVGAALDGAGPGGRGLFVKVLHAPGRCIGVTHPGDVDLVRAELAREVGRGDRPAGLFDASERPRPAASGPTVTP